MCLHFGMQGEEAALIRCAAALVAEATKVVEPHDGFKASCSEVAHNPTVPIPLLKASHVVKPSYSGAEPYSPFTGRGCK